MTTRYSLTLATATANLRTDLNDPAGASQRWQDADLQRALNKTLERITQVEPDLEEIQIQTATGIVDYAKPTGALWIDRVEYPWGQWPPTYAPFTELRSPQILAPLLPPALAQVTITPDSIANGTYTYAVTYTTPGGETTVGPTAVITLAGLNAATSLALPAFPSNVTTQKLYRTIAGGSQLKYLDTVFSPTTTYIDILPDASLGANAPTINTTGGTDIFQLNLPLDQYPPDTTTFYMSVRYALTHELDTLGTTIPERHWDTLYRGGMAEAVGIYLNNINDNFVYADGQLRDRVDDTKSVDAWRAWRNLLDEAFQQDLKRIRDEQIQSSRFTPTWGDKPLRWERL